MLKNILLATVIIIIACIGTYVLHPYYKKERADFFQVEAGAKIPDFGFKSINGQRHDLYDFNDSEKILLHFWATWCAPCVVEFPDLIEAAQNNENTTIIAFSSDRGKAAIDGFLNKLDVEVPDNFIIVHDDRQVIAHQKFSVFKLPETIVLDGDYIVLDHIRGANADWSDYLK